MKCVDLTRSVINTLTAKPLDASDRQRTRAMHTGSAAWRRLRQRVLLRDRYRCRGCGLVGDQVDHIDNDSHNNDMANLQTLCHSCHSTKTAKEQGR